MSLKKGHWILLGLTAIVVVLLLIAPHHPEKPVKVAGAEDLQPPTAENDIDSALAIIASSAPMQGILLLRSVAEENPGNFRAQYHLGRFSAQTGQWEKVIERFEIVKSIDASFNETNYWLGLAYVNLGEAEKGKAHLEQYVSGEIDNEELRSQAQTMLNQLN